MAIEAWELRERQKLPLEIKIKMSLARIREWYNFWNGKVYTSFSGGKDSTVLLNLVRSIYPEIPAVFVDTGLEYPEIRKFVKTIDNVEWLRPRMPFNQVIIKHGYPVISKEQAQFIRELQTTNSQKLQCIRLYGNKWGQGKISRKWIELFDAPFKISEKCCTVMKKEPIKLYEKETARKPFIGKMATESSKRTQDSLRGCNIFKAKRPMSSPLTFWTEGDIWDYLKFFNLPYSPIYDMGYERTGCMFCMFGVHLDKKPNRFQRMKNTHPIHHRYCMDNLGLAEVLDYIGVAYE